jgi:uncharacterized protein YdaU (DUF1376 family)
MKPDESKRKAPAFQFYADDFLAGTSDMSAEEVGGYIRLLCHQWTKGGIPNDQERAARMAGLIGSPSIGYVLAKFSPCDDGMLRNARLEQVRDQQTAFKAKQAVSGKAGAEKRWKKCPNDSDPNGEPIATPMATPMAERWPEDSSPSPTPTPKIQIQSKVQSPLTPQRGEEVIEKPTRSPWEVKFGLELPERLRTDECIEAAKLWLAYKAEKRQGYKPIGLKAAMTGWGTKYTAEQFPAFVRHSIAEGWQGIYPPRENGHQQSLGDNRYQTATADDAAF